MNPFISGDVGYHHGVPEEEYHAHPAYSRSRVSRLASLTPAHYKAYAPKPGKHFDVGAAVHAHLLEGAGVFRDRFVMAEQCSGLVGKDQRQCSRHGTVCDTAGNWWCHQHQGPASPMDPHPTTLTPDDYGQVENMAAALRDHAAVQEIMEARDFTEVTGLWEEDGALCRFRSDIQCGDVLWDYKTTRTTLRSMHVVSRVLADYNYHHQAGWYARGHEAITGRWPEFGFILQEKNPPYAIRVVKLHEADVRAGWEQMADALLAVRLCEQHDYWPGYPEEIDTVTMPDYTVGANFYDEDEDNG